MLYGGEKKKKRPGFHFLISRAYAAAAETHLSCKAIQQRQQLLARATENGHYLLFPSAVLVYNHQLVLCSDSRGYTTLSQVLEEMHTF